MMKSAQQSPVLQNRLGSVRHIVGALPSGMFLVVATIAVGCTSHAYRGRSPVALADVHAEPGILWSRPTEVAWRLGVATKFVEAVKPSEVASGTETGFRPRVVSATALPTNVQLAITRGLVEMQADGFLVTNYIIDTTKAEGTISQWTITILGYPLSIEDLGPVSIERADQARWGATRGSQMVVEARKRKDWLRARNAEDAAQPEPNAAPLPTLKEAE